jgi:Spy/CpxP family protein refolding chaperone
MKHALKAAVLSSCAFFLVTAAPAYAGHGFSGDDFEPGAHLMQLVRRANLTSQQQSQIHDILTASKAQEKQLRSQGAALHEQLADKILGTSTPTLADFSSLTQQMEQVHSQQIKLGLQAALQIRAVLTPAQVSHIAQMHQQLSNLNAQRSAVLQDDDDMDVPAPTEVQGRQ